MLKTLDRYIDDGASGGGPLTSLWSRLGRDRRFTFLFAMSVVVHVIFYTALIKLDSWAIQAIAGARRQAPLVRLTELAPPPGRAMLRAAPEALERADINRLEYDPAAADDVHLVQRSPKPAERRGSSAHLPPADLIEKQVRASRGSGGQERPGPINRQPAPPETSSIQATRLPTLEEALITQTPPSPSAPIPPAPSPKEDAKATSPGSAEPAQAGTSRGSSSDSSALGLEIARGQYMALVRAKIRKTNERNMPREWIKDVLRDKVSAEFKLVIRRDGQILSAELWKPTGYSVLDASARQAIFTASPFEGFPQAAGNTITVTVTVYFYTL